MANLKNLTTGTGRNAKPVELDGADVLAVRNLGYQSFSDGTFGHRRTVFTKASSMTVWEISKGKDAPPSISALDKLCGKQFTSVASLPSHGTSNASELASANKLIISVDPADVKDITHNDVHGSTLAENTGVNEAFTKSAKPEKLGKGIKMHYASLNIGENKVAAAHLDPSRFAKFEAATPA